ncbi:hypothetical protein T459_13329 [Capsicum annuum]|uniref:Uncharacterized protein n=1 Tax=Capsicum annuum TaxID=4072 RepID=A0A2G2ZSC1_CAPAN|nr:hypothetical protein T459_13329 [Capsicum annuum]
MEVNRLIDYHGHHDYESYYGDRDTDNLVKGHPLERLDHSRGLYSWHGIDTLPAGITDWTTLDQIRSISVNFSISVVEVSWGHVQSTPYLDSLEAFRLQSFQTSYSDRCFSFDVDRFYPVLFQFYFKYLNLMMMKYLIAPIKLEYQMNTSDNSSTKLATGLKRPAPVTGGCRIEGFVRVKQVPGNLIISARSEAHSFDASQMNMSHVTFSFSFGEILELGFPDDGYNYLEHLREIKNTGGGSAYYENPKAKLNELPHDVKAYDASRVEVVKVNDDSYEKYVYNVAAKTVGVRVQKAVDPEVAALLDDSDLSRFGSDDEDLELEEDFVIKANLPDGAVNVELDKNLSLPDKSDVDNVGSSDTAGNVQRNEAKFASFEEKPRACRLLDEQFDLYDERYVGGNERHESLAEKLNHAFKECAIDNNGPDDGELLEPAANVISRCRECAEKYENENPEEETALFEESSSDSEVWDCETIVSTYSNLDNHPGKIVPPESRRRKLLPAISEASPIISLKGKEKLPFDYLPTKGKHSVQKEDKKKRGSEKEEKDNSKTEQLKRKQNGQESRDEKKERKFYCCILMLIFWNPFAQYRLHIVGYLSVELVLHLACAI